ncbi:MULTISPECIES: acyltransferase family protein [Roseobacteraceae]|uniref:acyltransferase family protein n=1 Tax=Roseobacteraceae TaxID=2854170 RepID=UPI0031D23FBF
MSQPDPHKSAYLPHIDGLRTIAVMGVLWAHFGLPGLSGGFLGVDVFFVISGFLITRLIVREKISTGCFSYRRFYHRRLRRLMPAALATIAVSITAFYPILADKDLYSFLRSVPFTILPLANINFYNEVGYFDTGAQFKPLLHFWSLAVEEQFYFLWPTLLLLLFAWPRSLLTAMATLFLFSILGAEYWYAWDTSAVYYLLPFRTFELLAGALLAVLGTTPDYDNLKPRLSSRAKTVAGLLGMLVILFGYVWFDEHSQLPGLGSLFVCIGTVLVIACGSRGVLGNLLTARPVIWIGLISYSLYLVHWPLFVYTLYRSPGELPLLLRLALLPLAMGLAALSYHFVEKPFRHPVVPGQKRANLPFFAAITVAASLLIIPSLAYKLDPESRKPELLAMLSTGAAPASGEIPGIGTQGHFRTLRVSAATPDAPRVLVLGDSHAGHMMTGVRHLLAVEGISADLVSVTGCPPLVGLTIQRETDHAPDQSCVAAGAITELLAVNGDYDAVVLTSRWGVATGETDMDGLTLLHIDYIQVDDLTPELGLERSRRVFDESLSKTVAAITASGKRLVLLGQIPPTGNNLARCAAILPWLGQTTSDRERCQGLIPGEVRRRLTYSETLLSSIATSPEVLFLSAIPLFCDRNECLTQAPETGEFLYEDDNHLNKTGSLFYLSRLIRNTNLLPFLKGKNRADELKRMSSRETPQY